MRLPATGARVSGAMDPSLEALPSLEEFVNQSIVNVRNLLGVDIDVPHVLSGLGNVCGRCNTRKACREGVCAKCMTYSERLEAGLLCSVAECRKWRVRGPYCNACARTANYSEALCTSCQRICRVRGGLCKGCAKVE